MTREEAIETLKANYPDACYEQLREAVDAAIEALKAQDTAGDTIYRQVAIDAVHAMPDIKEIEKIIIDHIYIGDQKLTDLVASGRLRLVGFCEECKHCFPPLVSRVDGEVVQVTSERCSICNGYVEKNGWCYKFERRTDE